MTKQEKQLFDRWINTHVRKEAIEAVIENESDETIDNVMNAVENIEAFLLELGHGFFNRDSE